jgi:hypothetical protein
LAIAVLSLGSSAFGIARLVPEANAKGKVRFGGASGFFPGFSSPHPWREGECLTIKSVISLLKDRNKKRRGRP